MKNIILLALLSILNLIFYGQNDLAFYISQAKQNSPLIQDNKNQSEANKVEIERLKAL